MGWVLGYVKHKNYKSVNSRLIVRYKPPEFCTEVFVSTLENYPSFFSVGFSPENELSKKPYHGLS